MKKTRFIFAAVASLLIFTAPLFVTACSDTSVDSPNETQNNNTNGNNDDSGNTGNTSGNEGGNGGSTSGGNTGGNGETGGGNTGGGEGGNTGGGNINTPGSGTPSITNSMTLVWSDEFDECDSDGTPLSSKWGYDIGRGQSVCTDGRNPNNWAWGNEEVQWYSDNNPKNTYVSNGTLKIKAIKETGPDNNATYTSGRIVTRHIPNAQFKYGYIEARAKLPAAKGTWPAFWMLDNDIYDGEGWPDSGEIDIMEAAPSVWGISQADAKPGIYGHTGNVWGTLHCKAGSGGNPIISDGTFVDDITQWHTYAVNWTEDKIEWYYDGNKFLTYTPANKENDAWPFCDDFYIILNLAVGGNLGGAIDASWNEAVMEVDYVRVYQGTAGEGGNTGSGGGGSTGGSNDPAVDISSVTWMTAVGGSKTSTENKVYLDTAADNGVWAMGYKGEKGKLNEIVNVQKVEQTSNKDSIYTNWIGVVNSSDITGIDTSLVYGLTTGGIWFDCDIFTAEYTEFTVNCGGVPTTLVVYNKNGSASQ